MAVAKIPVDLFNPGQVFACIGLVDAAESLLGNAAGSFDGRDESHPCFWLSARGDVNPVAAVLDFLASARVHSEVPDGAELSTQSPWGVPTKPSTARRCFPFPLPDSPATLPAVLEGTAELCGVEKARLVIDYWGDQTDRDAAKFWAGSGGYPGAALVRDALELVRPRVRDAAAEPFNLSTEQSSSFRLDWRRDNVPIDLGFNLNAQARIGVAGFPLVELLGALGLGSARPQPLDRLTYRYWVSAARLPAPQEELDGRLLDPALLRAGLGARLPLNQRQFLMRLQWPGKEGQARAITTVTEERNP